MLKIQTPKSKNKRKKNNDSKIKMIIKKKNSQISIIMNVTNKYSFLTKTIKKMKKIKAMITSNKNNIYPVIKI